VEYETSSTAPLHRIRDNNAPCAVCHVIGRDSLLMVPARKSCPDNWTKEYYGYLMTAFGSASSRRSAVCVDGHPEVVPGESANDNGALFYHMEATCNGFQCPPYDREKELTCAVCTK
jgi:hypothetical protein